MNGRIFTAAAVALTAYAISSVPVFGDSLGYYTPPKLIKQGTSSIPVAGNGTVLIQVLVNPDASFKVQKIIQSSNPEDNQAAMEIANTAKYAPAIKGGKKIAAFYTYRLKFVVTAKTSTSLAVNPSPLAKYDADVHAGHYVDARSGLQSYLQSHPDDPQANSLLGVSEFFLNNFSESAAAFSKAGTVSSQFTTVAANAFAKAAQAAIAAKNGAAAVAYATKAKALTPGAATWNLLGNAQLVNNDSPGAIQSFEQARALSPNDSKLDPKERGTITANLIAAYADSDQIDKAVALLPEMKQEDPDNGVGLSHVVDYYAKKAQASISAGKTSDAIAAYEKGGSYGGPLAHTMYTNEALLLTKQVHPDWIAVKTAADKAIALKPDDARANLAAGVALYNQRRSSEAVSYLEKAASAAKAGGDTDAFNMAQHWITEITGAGSGAAKPAPTPKPSPSS
ncbi:MAG: tetratricopeptide repeat protein [Vulcanimicrobiaceae bacterium]|jgi:tetratricopeptide (TPR) repeat protein